MMTRIPQLFPHAARRDMTLWRTISAVHLAVIVATLSCAPGPPPRVGEYHPAESHPLYEERHILDLAWQLRDVSRRASSDAVSQEERGTPDYGPLALTTSLGLQLTYGVTFEFRQYRHQVRIAYRGEGLSDEVALNLLHFATDLLGVMVKEATRDPTGAYGFVIELDDHDQAVLLGNLDVLLSEDDILHVWKQAVLKQTSSEPIPLRAES